MILEGTTTSPTLPYGEVKVVIRNTTHDEVKRIANVLSVICEQGLFNSRNGAFTLSFNKDGHLGSINFQGVKWKEGKESISRISQYEKIAVHIGT